MQEFFEGVQGIAAADWFIAVNGQVADFLDGEDLPSTSLRNRRKAGG